ncbi:uncharacterized protein LOC119688194 [Teleopsis dalmanni]|uniref:uncharacterized protein LOC119688194 n=1 Tax=Teleopsis dalmanni TaxID=139649 RepID=UPI0018CF2157|nr:uncharacterized protein LOC119688194 [Teleopsis dalmanni]
MEKKIQYEEERGGKRRKEKSSALKNVKIWKKCGATTHPEAEKSHECHLQVQIFIYKKYSINCRKVLNIPHLTDDAEVIDVPKSQQGVDPDFKNFRGVVDTGVGYPFFQPNPNPFSLNFGFFDSFDDIFRRLRTRLWPATLSGGIDDSSEEGGNPFNIDPKNGNTTSEVKIVDGHRVEVNETRYGDKNSVFKVRIVNIRPLESGEDVTNTNTNTNTDVNTETRTNGQSPVTTAPKTNKVNDDDDDESDERREPLAKKPNENEIPKGNLDDPEVK